MEDSPLVQVPIFDPSRMETDEHYNSVEQVFRVCDVASELVNESSVICEKIVDSVRGKTLDSESMEGSYSSPCGNSLIPLEPVTSRESLGRFSPSSISDRCFPTSSQRGEAQWEVLPPMEIQPDDPYSDEGEREGREDEEVDAFPDGREFNYLPYYSARERYIRCMAGRRRRDFYRRRESSEGKYQFASRERPWSPPREENQSEIEFTGVGAGLANLGNTCFINAILQCFTHTVQLVLSLRRFNDGNPCAREPFCVLCALRDHIELSLSSSGGVIVPSKFFDNLNNISSFFQKYQQEDAHEFLQCFLDRLGDCCSDMEGKNEAEDDDIVKQVFSGRLVSKLCCCNCGHSSYTKEALIDLSLEIDDMDTLLSALESFTRVERIEDPEAKFRCESCKEKVTLEKQLMLDRAPSVAAFHLKRFKSNGCLIEKIDKHVEFPLELDLQPYTWSNTSGSQVNLRYHLYAVVKHSGSSPTSGHYVCYIRSSPETWHRLNDSLVTRVEEDVVLSQEAYILFYARQDSPWFSSAIEVKKAPLGGAHGSNSSPKSVSDDAGVENTRDEVAEEAGEDDDGKTVPFSCEPLLDFAGEKNPQTPAAASPKSPCGGENSSSQNADPQVGSSTEMVYSGEPLKEVKLGNRKRHMSNLPPAQKREAPTHIKKTCDPQRDAAARYLKRMPVSRRTGLLAAMMETHTGYQKPRKTRSSPCVRGSHRRANQGSVLRPVSVFR